MFVREVMTRHAATVGADETLEAAARRMRELGVGALPVLDRGLLCGMVTDRDVAVRGVAAGADPRRAPVRDAMTTQVLACREDDEIEEAARRMESGAVRRLVVLDREGELSGMLSVEDLAQASFALAGEVLRSGREPELALGAPP